MKRKEQCGEIENKKQTAAHLVNEFAVKFRLCRVWGRGGEVVRWMSRGQLFNEVSFLIIGGWFSITSIDTLADVLPVSHSVWRSTRSQSPIAIARNNRITNKIWNELNWKERNWDARVRYSNYIFSWAIKWREIWIHISHLEEDILCFQGGGSWTNCWWPKYYFSCCSFVIRYYLF